MNTYGIFTGDKTKISVIHYNRELEEIDRRNYTRKTNTNITLVFIAWLLIFLAVPLILASFILSFFFGIIWTYALIMYFSVLDNFTKSEKVFVRGKWRKYL